MNYLLDQMTGVWAMAFNREGWQSQLDRSVDGVFRSFWAFIPAFLLTLLISYMLGPILETLDADIQQEPLLLPAVPASLLLFVRFSVEWALSLGMLLFVATRFSAKNSAVDIVLGYNWSRLYLAILTSVPYLLLSLSGMREIAGLVFLPVAILSVALVWGMLRRAMPTVETPIIVGMLIGLMVIHILMVMAISSVAELFAISK